MMRKTLTKVVSLILALMLFVLMAAASGSSDDKETKAISAEPTEAAEAAKEEGDSEEAVNETETEKETETEAEKAEAVTIEEQVLVEQDGVRITAKEYTEDAFFGEGIRLLIENDTEKNITVGCNALIVNNFMITDLFAASVASGKKSNETMYMSSSGLEAAGIEEVGQVEIYFHVYDSDSFDDLFNTDVVTIKTSAFERMDTTPDDEGKELFNEEGIRIVGKYVDENSFWGAGILLYIENTSERNVSISCDNFSVNGFMLTPIFYTDIYAGKQAIDDITLMSSELEENGIESITDIELSFHISDLNSYETIRDTGAISFSVE